MADLAQRFASNPILTPANLVPSHDGLLVEGVLNPGAFRFGNKIGLLLRVAERFPPNATQVQALINDDDAPGGTKTATIPRSDPALVATDPRIFFYDGIMYLTTLSHLRLVWSDDGVHFTQDEHPFIGGEGPLETFGIEDCRVTQIEETYYLTYTAVSRSGFGVGLRSTRDWQTFTKHGVILPPNNKDCALFPRRVGEKYFMLHRPTIDPPRTVWLGSSPDLIHWGEHRPLFMARPGMWDSARVGAGDAPIWTEEGWLEIYHGADEQHRYCLGAVLLAHDDPSRVLARSVAPIMEPLAEYEQHGFFGNVVFTNGTLRNGDELLIYYGASDTVVCGAKLSLGSVFDTLR